MSGIVGLLRLDGGPLDGRLLEALTGMLAFRGPDRSASWSDGPVGLGHTLLATTHEAAHERQPLELGNQVWITADARVDARAELIGELRARGQPVPPGVTDPELILRAYLVWDLDCTRHLLGDFAFAIWDGRVDRLVCARDHFGVKPFYYARTPSSFVFSNTLDCVRAHPEVTDRLNEQAIGDFLLFEQNTDHATTTFADVLRLPPGHQLVVDAGGVRIRRYWCLPVEEPLIGRRTSYYVDWLGDTLRSAVSDRCRADRVGISLSGGMDSATIAALAGEEARRTGMSLRARTTAYEWLIPDPEPRYTRLVAGALHVPLDCHYLDEYRLFDRFDEPALSRPEPDHNPLRAGEVDFDSALAAHGRVALTGEGGDVFAAVLPLKYLRAVRMSLGWRASAGELARFTWLQPALPYAIRALATRIPHSTASLLDPPSWLEPDFVKRCDLHERWRQHGSGSAGSHPFLPAAASALVAPGWQQMTEGEDPGSSRLPVEMRHPFLDVRVVRCFLRLPALSLCTRKKVLRLLMRGTLPPAILTRPKTTVLGDPLAARLRRPEARWLNDLRLVPELGAFVRAGAIPRLADESIADGQHSVHLRPISLHYWLTSSCARYASSRWSGPALSHRSIQLSHG